MSRRARGVPPAVTRRAIATIGTGPMGAVLDVTLPTMRAFGEQHGYDLVVGDGSTAHGRPPAWAKVPLIHGLLDTYDEVLWIDADAAVVQLDVDLPPTAPGSFQSLVRHTTHEGDVAIPNTGVWRVQAGRDARRFLAEVWADERWVEHKWWDNAGVLAALGYALEPLPVSDAGATRWRHGTEWLDEEWNAIHRVSEVAAPRIFHVAGLDITERCGLLREALR